ncbi:unnamed protein product [Tuber melanosporum]|uniref:(Perigord truffle) hypothetical protein n=1 Tax=Tuber melanosporum (strain Mel28) TaxID=656061 RepID=D5GNM1_TUBMM|nr:uncharacterized protein GSTUM_00011361001 [Tuber melanosporum]CAZ86114.1 unnamed protein product [Tuber melanosporum]
MYRDEIKAKRTKKIKSKSYRRILNKRRGKLKYAIEEVLAHERGGMPNEEDVVERERKRVEEKDLKTWAGYGTGFKRASNELQMGIAGNAVPQEDEEFECGGHREEDDVFNGD